MDNDDKVIKKLSPSEFLPEFTDNSENTPKLYDLTEEFRKTGINKNNLTIILTLFFVFFITGFAIFFSGFIQKRYENLEINIDDFEDINLIDLLNASKKYENDLNIINADIKDIDIKMNDEINEIKIMISEKIDSLINSSGDKNYIRRMTSVYRLEEENAILAVKDRYNVILDNKQKERELVFAKIESYDMRQLEKAKQNEEVLQSQKQLYELEMKDIIASYEARIKKIEDNLNGKIYNTTRDYENYIYSLKKKNKIDLENQLLKFNPIYDDNTLDLALSTVSNTTKLSFDADENILKFNNKLLDDKILSISSKINTMNYINQKILEIPYTNSVPDMLNGSMNYSYTLINDFSEITKYLNKEIYQKNLLIANNNEIQYFYRKALKNYLRTTGDTGIVINADNKNNVFFYYNELLTLKEGMMIKIFRYDNDYIGTLKAFYNGSDFRGEVIELKEGKFILPFDKLYFDLKSGLTTLNNDDVTSDIEEQK